MDLFEKIEQFPGIIPRGAAWQSFAAAAPWWAVPFHWTAFHLGGVGTSPAIFGQRRLRTDVNGLRLDFLKIKVNSTSQYLLRLLRNGAPYDTELGAINWIGGVNLWTDYPLFAVYEAGDEIAFSEETIPGGLDPSPIVIYGKGWYF